MFSNEVRIFSNDQKMSERWESKKLFFVLLTNVLGILVRQMKEKYHWKPLSSVNNFKSTLIYIWINKSFIWNGTVFFFSFFVVLGLMSTYIFETPISPATMFLFFSRNQDKREVIIGSFCHSIIDDCNFKIDWLFQFQNYYSDWVISHGNCSLSTIGIFNLFKFVEQYWSYNDNFIECVTPKIFQCSIRSTTWLFSLYSLSSSTSLRSEWTW